MRKFIFAEKKGIYIIDLQKTLKQLEKAYEVISQVVKDGGTVLFVGTKKQVQDVVREESERCEMYHVTNRWLGGMLTNFQTIKKNINRLKEFEQMKEEGTFERFTKKEVLMLERDMKKLDFVLGGIKEMASLPDIVFIVDAKKEKIAINEASRLNIPIVAIVDTNTDPDPISIPVAGNDDAIRSVRLISRIVADAVLEGSSHRKKEEAVLDAETAESSEEKTDQDKSIEKPSTEDEKAIEKEEVGEATSTEKEK
jgi:small subunit ribosomal protein S2